MLRQLLARPAPGPWVVSLLSPLRAAGGCLEPCGHANAVTHESVVENKRVTVGMIDEPSVVTDRFEALPFLDL